jgi:hypothetical protein
MADDEQGFSQPDVSALHRIRSQFERHEPLVTECSFDSLENQTMLSVTLSDGFYGPGRFDIRWSFALSDDSKRWLRKYLIARPATFLLITVCRGQRF